MSKQIAKKDDLSIPAFLLRKNWKKGAKVSAVKLKARDLTEGLPPLPNGMRYAANESEETGSQATSGVIPLRWASDPAIARHAFFAANNDPKAKTVARTADKTKERATVKAVKDKLGFGKDLRIIPGTPTTRKAGSACYNRLVEMLAYIKANPGHSVAEVLEKLPYTRADFNWDLAKGVIKTDVRNAQLPPKIEAPKKKKAKKK